MPVEQPERAAEEVDPGREQRRPDPVVVEDDRLDQVVEMALVVRDVHDPPAPGGLDGVFDMFGDAANLSQDGIERMLECAVEAVPLRRTQLLEVLLDSLPRVRFGRALDAAEVPRDVIARQHRLDDVVRSHCDENYTRFRTTSSANAVVVADPPRSAVRTPPSTSVRSSAVAMREAAAVSPM